MAAISIATNFNHGRMIHLVCWREQAIALTIPNPERLSPITCAMAIYQQLSEGIGAGTRKVQLRRDLPDGTVAVSAAIGGRAVEITGGIEYHVTDREGPVAAARKIMERSVRPAAA
jgi:hypothetical protein